MPLKKRKSSHDAAREKGQQAARDGKDHTACPYTDVRTDRGCVTFARSYLRQWYAGYLEVKKGLVK